MDNNSINNSESKKIESAELRNLGIKVNECILKQSWFTVTGVVIGTFIGARSKSFKPLIRMSGIGIAADLIYARNYACSNLVEQYQEMKKKNAIEIQSQDTSDM